MRAMKWLGWVAGLSLAGYAIAADRAIAQLPPNQSDITGTNIFDNPIIIIQPGEGLDPDILDTARRLADEIDDAYLACACDNSATTGPRRFARGPGDPNAVCANPACDRLEQLLEEANVFLKNLDAVHARYIKTYRNRIW